MDIEGRPIQGENLDSGGTIQGDLIITGDLTGTDAVFDNLTVSQTATINNLITNQELKIEDTLIELGINNPADNLNLGIIEHFNDGTSERYSGLIRDRNTKKQYLFENSIILPSTTTDMTTLQKGDLVVNNLESNNLKIISSDNEFLDFVDSGNASNGWSLGRDLNLTNDLEFVYDKPGSPSVPLIMKNDGIVAKKITVDFQYTLPLTDGTPGQVIQTDGAGNLNFTNQGGNLQDAFDNSIEPQITTDLTNGTMVIRQGVGVSDPISEIQDDTGTPVVEMKNDTTTFNQLFVRHEPVSGDAFQYISAGPSSKARLIVGDSNNTDALVSLFSDQSVVDVRGITSSKVGIRLASDSFSFIQDSTNPDILRLDTGPVPGADVRMRCRPTTGEMTFGPDEFIKLVPMSSITLYNPSPKGLIIDEYIGSIIMASDRE